MAKYQKIVTVEARQYEGAPLTVVNNLSGEAVAISGDYLTGTSLGFISVIPKATFEAEYEPFSATVNADEYTAVEAKLAELQGKFDALTTEHEQLAKLYAVSQTATATETK